MLDGEARARLLVLAALQQGLGGELDARQEAHRVRQIGCASVQRPCVAEEDSTCKEKTKWVNVRLAKHNNKCLIYTASYDPNTNCKECKSLYE